MWDLSMGQCLAGVPPADAAAGLLGFDGSRPEQAPILQQRQTTPDLSFDLSYRPPEPDAAALWQLLDAPPQEAAAAAPQDPCYALAPGPVHTRHDDLAAGGWFEQPPGPRGNAVPFFSRGTAPAWDDTRCAAAVISQTQSVADWSSMPTVLGSWMSLGPTPTQFTGCSLRFCMSFLAGARWGCMKGRTHAESGVLTDEDATAGQVSSWRVATHTRTPCQCQELAVRSKASPNRCGWARVNSHQISAVCRCRINSSVQRTKCRLPARHGVAHMACAGFRVSRLSFTCQCEKMRQRAPLRCATPTVCCPCVAVWSRGGIRPVGPAHGRELATGDASNQHRQPRVCSHACGAPSPLFMRACETAQHHLSH